MKNGKIFLLLAFLGAFHFGCQKESALSGDLNNSAQPYVKTVIRYTVGEKTYELSSVRQEISYETNNGCGGYGCGNAAAKDAADNWSTFSTGNFLSVIRQDDAGKPAFRLSIFGTIDLNANVFPANVDNARLALNDFNGALIQPTDDPAYNTGALYFEGSADAVQLTIHSRNGNVVEGTFSGILKMANGSALEIRDGTFTAQLNGL